MALPSAVWKAVNRQWLYPLLVWLDGITANTLDGTAAHIQPIGAVKSAGSQGKAADSGHVHQLDKAAFHVDYFAGHNGAGAVTVANLKAGDQVLFVFDITDGTDGSSYFESTVTVTGQLQQSSALNLSAKNFFALVIAKS